MQLRKNGLTVNYSSLKSGFTFGTGVCTSENVALSEDLTRTFNGVVTFVHELSHL